MPRSKLLVVVGATASGKTATAVMLAKMFGNAEIISGDAFTVYKGFDIGTAKPTQEERSGVPHHLIDSLEPTQSWNVTAFKSAAEKIIAELTAADKLPILAGGTGLYVKALLEGYEFNKQQQDAAYRNFLAERSEKFGREFLLAELKKVDGESAARLQNGDMRRIIRALEVANVGREKISAVSCYKRDGKLVFDAYVAGLDIPRGELYKKIDERVKKMLAQGLVEEVRRLLADGVTADCGAMKAIGYHECAAFLAGKIRADELAEEIAKATRHFAKRQMTWYRKMPYIEWFDATDDSAAVARRIKSAAENFWRHGTKSKE